MSATSFILRLGCLLRPSVEKERVEGKRGGTSPESRTRKAAAQSSKTRENPKFPRKNGERESLRPELQVNPLGMGHDVSQQPLGLWCQKGVGTSRDADAPSCCSGW